MDDLDRAGAAVVAAPVGQPTPLQKLRPRVRRRVQRRRAVVALAVVVALGVPAAAFAAATRSDRGSVGIHTVDTGGSGSTTSSTTREPSTGSRVDADNVFSLTFVDEEHGYAIIGHVNSGRGLAATSDGGATWHAIGTLPKTADTIEFTSPRDGWAFGADRFVTHDSGHTWTSTHPGGRQVDALDAIGSSVWSLVRCSADQTDCAAHLETSSDGGQTWQSTHLPGLPAGPAELDRVDGVRAFVFSAFGSPEAQAGIISTVDAGRSWNPLGNPCGRQQLGGFSAVNGSDLWLSCSFSGAPTVAKRLFRSRDGGRTWTLTARVGMPGLADVGTLPFAGYGAGLIALSDRDAILSSGRGQVSVSVDGGHAWSPAIDFDEFYGSITRLRGSDSVWVASAHSLEPSGVGGVWRATDGVHFRQIAVGTVP